MRASEFLRALANTMDALENGVEFPGQSKKDQPVDDNVGEYTPPLQTKIELLKKANNVKSVYDTDDNDETLADTVNRLEAADDDGPFEG
jgi:hypothetical protein